MPRFYTIASSTLVHPNDIRIAISLSKFDTPYEKGRLGLVSALCEKMLTDTSFKVRIFARESNFVMKKDRPLFMVGPGTGIVPFIAFSDERTHLKNTLKEQITEAHLWFGCREKDNDFIYRDYLAEQMDKGIINGLNFAFSRPKDGSPKHYVQDLIKQKPELVERLLRKENGVLYICGATKMGSDV